MKEEDLAQLFEGYRDALGTCSRTPGWKRRARRPFLLLSPLALAACGLAVLIWPKDASAATLKRLSDAITNAKSMQVWTFHQGSKGNWELWQRGSYDSGRWRYDYLINEMRTAVTMIFRDGLCYEYHGNLNYATIRPGEAIPNYPKLRGQALEVIEDQLTHYFKGAKFVLGASDPIDGKPTYRVSYDLNQGRPHIDLIVNKETDLPVSAEMTTVGQPEQHMRWKFAFNVSVPNRRFEVPANRRIIDLRKTIPAFEAAHQKPLATVEGLQILDACVVRDGTIWIATKSSNVGFNIVPHKLFAAPGVLYTFGENVAIGAKLSPVPELAIYGFAPLNGLAPSPRVCTVTVEKSTISQPIPDSQSVTASQILGDVGKATLALRSESGPLPSYFPELGTDDDVSHIPFSIRLAKAWAFERYGQHAVAAPIFEKIGNDCTPEYGLAYRQWMSEAIEDYRKGGREADAARLEKKGALFPLHP